LPGGRNSSQKPQKGPGKKKSWLEEFMAEFHGKWQIRGRRKLSKELSDFIVKKSLISG
jgi:hypothetical protein